MSRVPKEDLRGGHNPSSGIPAHLGRPNIVLLICFLLTVATLTAFWPVRHCDFVDYDDQDYVTENSHVRAGLTREGIAWAFRSAEFSNWHPMTWLSHMLDCQFYGLVPQGHHMTSLVLHVANTLLLFLVLRGMTGATWRSAFVSSAFALHPLHVESVAWVAERKDVLSTFFFMLALWAYVRCVERKADSTNQKAKGRKPPPLVLKPQLSWYCLTLVFFAFALMSKPMLVTLPFLLLLLDYWPLRRFELSTFNSQPSTLIRLLLEKLPFFLLAFVSSLITLRAQQSGGAVVPTDALALNLRSGNALVSCFRYVRKTFWPDDLAVFYPHPGAWPWWQVVGAGVFLAAVSILVVGRVRQRPELLVGWLWFLGTLVPVLGLVQVGMQSMADRYAYVPLIGIFIMVAWLLADLTADLPRRALVLWPVATGALLACWMTTRGQAWTWQNTERLFQHALDVTTNNDVAHNALGQLRQRQGNLGEAIAHLQEALRINPNLAAAHNNMGVALCGIGNTDVAISHFREAVRLDPGDASAHNNLAGLLSSQGRIDEALAYLKRALEIRPDYADAHNNLGLALLRQGRLAEAVASSEQSLRLKTEQWLAHKTLAITFAHQGRLESAVTHFQLAVEHGADPVEMHNNLRKALTARNEIEGMITYYRMAIRLDLDGSRAFNNLAWLLATHPDAQFRDGTQAVELAARAVELTSTNDASKLDTLAAAYAEAGRFTDAVEAAKKAVALANASGSRLPAQEIEARLRLYERGQPFREAALSPPRDRPAGTEGSSRRSGLREDSGN